MDHFSGDVRRPPAATLAGVLTSATPDVLAAGPDADIGAGADIFRRLLKERIVFIGSAIDQNTANLVCSQLILLEAEDPDQDISVYINSPGARSPTAWPSTTPCSTSGRTSGPPVWAWPPRWDSSSCAPVRRASASPSRTAGS